MRGHEEKYYQEFNKLFERNALLRVKKRKKKKDKKKGIYNKITICCHFLETSLNAYLIIWAIDWVILDSQLISWPSSLFISIQHLPIIYGKEYLGYNNYFG